MENWRPVIRNPNFSKMPHNFRLVHSLVLFFVPKGWDLKKGLFSFYPLCVQSELSLVKHVLLEITHI